MAVAISGGADRSNCRNVRRCDSVCASVREPIARSRIGIVVESLYVGNFGRCLRRQSSHRVARRGLQHDAKIPSTGAASSRRDAAHSSW